jgi:hypothetical protein
LFSTELQPSNEISEIEKWWYIVPEGGQHISFYNKLTFQQIESLLNVNYYTDNNNLHILSKNVLSKNPFGNKKKKITNRNIILERFIYKIANKFNYRYSKLMNDDKPKSLTMVDFEFIKQKITNHGN